MADSSDTAVTEVAALSAAEHSNVIDLTNDDDLVLFTHHFDSSKAVKNEPVDTPGIDCSLGPPPTTQRTSPVDPAGVETHLGETDTIVKMESEFIALDTEPIVIDDSDDELEQPGTLSEDQATKTTSASEQSIEAEEAPGSPPAQCPPVPNEAGVSPANASALSEFPVMPASAPPAIEVEYPGAPQSQVVQRFFKKPRDRAEENKKAAERFAAMRKARGEQVQKEVDHAIQQHPSGSTPQRSNDVTEDLATPTEGSWEMEEIDHEKAAKDFAALKRSYNRRKDAGNTTLVDHVAFSKAEAQEKMRLKRLEGTRAYEARERLGQERLAEETDGLFVSDDDEIADVARTPPKRATSLSLNSEGGPPRKRAKTDKPIWGRHIPVQAIRDSHDIGIDSMEFQEAKKKRGRKPADPAGKKSAKKGKAAKKQDDTAAPKKRGRPKKGPVMSNVQSLYTSNLVADAQAGSGNANTLQQPGFGTATGRDRGKALQQLLASIPEEDRKTASADKNALVKACQSFAGKRMKPDGKAGWKLKGMETSLYHYQLLGAAFMRDRENGERPHGGLLCDSMGFGKSIMLLSNVVGDCPPASDKHRTTLIVASPALCTQWMSEIAKHVTPGTLTAVKYHANSRMVSNDTAQDLQRFDIVLTTYGELQRSYPTPDPPINLVSEDEKTAWWKKHYEENVGILHKIYWRRICLDEAQAIKNHRSKTSIAARALLGKYRWAITGTPLYNAIAEFYPYFQFLKVLHTGNMETFRHNFMDGPGDVPLGRLHSYLRTIMIRRTHVDTLFGRPLLKLPEIEHATIPLEFNEFERCIYNIVKARFVNQINNYAKQGVLTKKYSSILTMLLRLRQLTSHILLVQETLEDLLTLEDIEKLMLKTRAEVNPQGEKIKMLEALRKMMQKHKEQKRLGKTAVASILSEEDIAQQSPAAELEEDPKAEDKGYGYTFKLRKVLTKMRDSKKWADLSARSLCHLCLDPPDVPWVTSCSHLYCEVCLKELQYRAFKNDQERATCIECDNVFDGAELCKGLEELGHTIETPLDAGASDRSNRGRSTSKDEDKTYDWINLEGHLLPSTKTVATKLQIQEWLSNSPDNNIIVYTQFLSMIRILGRVCEMEKWSWCQYHGKMSFDARDKTIQDFSKGKKRIMLASLQAGGLGLNLTAASKVILLDLWWNECVENQAFARVYRIGQLINVSVVRFVVNNTVDDQLQALQQSKSIEIDKAIGEGSKPGRLSIPELLKLFGPLDEGEFILVDDESALDETSNQDPSERVPPRPF